MSDIEKHRTPEHEVVKIEQHTNIIKNHISAGLAKYFRAISERLNYLEYGDPAEYLLKIHRIDIPKSTLNSIWVPPKFRHQDETGDEIAFETFLADETFCKVILAEPGCGKSTLARYVSCEFINKFIENKQNYFGLLVPLSTLRLSGKSYQEAIVTCAAKYIGLDEDVNVIEDLKNNLSNACIIFDGFDELPTSRKSDTNIDSISLRRDVAELIRSYIIYPQVQENEPKKIIVTCRSKDYFDNQGIWVIRGVPQYFMSKFSPTLMNLAVFKWHEAAKKRLSEYYKGNNSIIKLLDERRLGIQSALREYSDLAAVCLTPLMLSSLQTVYSDVKDLPSSVSQLCWRAINWFFIEKYYNTVQDDFVKEHGEWLLETIIEIGWKAHHRIAAGDKKSFDNDDLRSSIRKAAVLKNFNRLDYDIQEYKITSIASFLRRGHGVFVKVSDDEIDFVHNVFREVVAGRALGKLSVPERRAYASEELWHSPIKFWAGLKASEKGGLHEISAFVGELSQDISLGNILAILACGEMLVEVSLIVVPEEITITLKKQLITIRDELCQLLKEKNLSIAHRVRIGDLFATLGDPRLETSITDRVISIPEGEYRIGRSTNHLTRIKKYEKCPASPSIVGHLNAFKMGAFLVTNKEFQDFITAGGYNTEKYWPNETALKWAKGDRFIVKDLIKKANENAQIHLSSELVGQRILLDEIPDRCIQMIDRRLPLYWVDPTYNRQNQPVVGINWWEAVAYCSWLETTLRQNELLDVHQTVRLPLEVEWECVARLCSDNNNNYPWIDGEPADCALVRSAFNNNVSPPLLRSCGVGLFQSVKSKLPIFDLVGNVWEWTSSTAHPYSQRSFDQILNIDSVDDRIARGSSWLSSEEESTHVTFRSFDPPYNAYEDLGFRIVIQ